MNFRKKPRKQVEVSLTPMIDVVFLLLIFFMVTTSFNRETELNIMLPKAQGSEKKVQKKVVLLTIDADGLYYVDNHQVINQQPGTLRKALKEATGDKQNLPLIISADAKTTHQAVINALDIAQQIGLTHITFAAKNTGIE
jgi:biopolymer transport protein ExbD